MKDLIELLERAEIRPTSNRILVLQALRDSALPLSLTELEDIIGTMERSSIFRTLTLLLEKQVVHAVEDGRGVVKYEICHADHHHSLADMHVHFYCRGCNNVFCLENQPIPAVTLPSGFNLEGVNFMLKGLCNNCVRHGRK